MYSKKHKRTKGFTLVEMMVAVTLFAVVMVVATGSLLSLVTASRKAQSLHSVMDNLNIALDGMVRNMRMGDTYRCGGPNPVTPNCTDGDTSVYFEPFGDSTPGDSSDDWVYWYDEDENGIGRLYRSEDGGSNSYAITAAEVDIEEMEFFVIGATEGDTAQPRVVVVMKGTAGADDVRTRTTFHIQATATQRSLDI